MVKTSAGVFTPQGRLVRTLWSNVEKAAGKHVATWDGTDDDGSLATAGSYQVKVLSSKFVYTWEGVVGNTSREKTGPTVHHPLMVPQGMAVAGKTAYFTTGYNEGYTAQFRFELDQPRGEFDVAGDAVLPAPPSGRDRVDADCLGGARDGLPHRLHPAHRTGPAGRSG